MMQAPFISNGPSRRVVGTAGAMIRMAESHRLCPIKLFHQHEAHQKVRPCQRTERQDKIGTVDDRSAQALGTADKETDWPRQFGPLPQLRCQSLAIEGVTCQIERNRESVAWQRAKQGGGFLPLYHRGTTPCLRHFHDGQARAKSLVVAVEE